MNPLKNTPGHTVAWAFLLTLFSVSGLMSASLHKEMDENRKGISLQPYELFARKEINSAAGIYEFVNNTVNAAQGICNVDKGKLPSNELFIFNELSVGFSAGAEANKAGEVAYKTKPSAEFRNAEFEIRQGGRLVLNLPIASLCNNHTANASRVDSNFVSLGSLCYLRDDQDFTISYKFPSGVSIPASTGSSDHIYSEVRLRGHRTVRKG